MGSLLDLLGAMAGGYLEGRERKYQYSLAAEQEKRQRDLFQQQINSQQTLQQEHAQRQAWLEAHSTPAHFDNLANYMAGTEKINPILFEDTRYLYELLSHYNNMLRPRSYGLRAQQQTANTIPLPSLKNTSPPLQSTPPLSLLGKPLAKNTDNLTAPTPPTPNLSLGNSLQKPTLPNLLPAPYSYNKSNPYALPPLPPLPGLDAFSIGKRKLKLPTSKTLKNKLKRNMPKL